MNNTIKLKCFLDVGSQSLEKRPYPVCEGKELMTIETINNTFTPKFELANYLRCILSSVSKDIEQEQSY